MTLTLKPTLMTTEKLIDLVFTEIHELKEATLSKKDETDGNQWTKFRKRLRCWPRKNGGYVMLNMLSNC